MKNVKSLVISEEDKKGLSYLEKIILGLWQLKIRWCDDYGFDEGRFVIDYGEEDVWMNVEDWLCVRFEPMEGAYFVEQCFEGKWVKVGSFDVEEIGLIAERHMKIDDWKLMEESYGGDSLYDEDFNGVMSDLEKRVFADREIGNYEKKVKHKSYKSVHAESVMDDVFNGMGETFGGA